MDKPVILAVKDLAFAYDDSPVFTKVNFHLHEKDFATVVGANGGGKTTLLRLLLGLLKPQAGSIRLFGESPEQARPKIGYMPQHTAFDMQFPITTEEVVLAGRLDRHRWFGRYNGEDRRNAEQALTEVGLESVLKKPFFSLSGGQKRRVLIARALVSQPQMLILDEPTANLDPQAEQGFYQLLHKLNERMSILMVSHDLNFVSSFVNTVICVNRQVVVHPTAAMPPTLGGEELRGRMRVILHDQLGDCGVKH